MKTIHLASFKKLASKSALEKWGFAGESGENPTKSLDIFLGILHLNFTYLVKWTERKRLFTGYETAFFTDLKCTF